MCSLLYTLIVYCETDKGQKFIVKQKMTVRSFLSVEVRRCRETRSASIPVLYTTGDTCQRTCSDIDE